MPPRVIQFISGHFYHLYNKTIDGRRLFADENLSALLLKLWFYYRSSLSKVSYSQFIKLAPIRQTEIRQQLSKKNLYNLNILTYCIMPNHFHLLVKQKKNGSISKFMSDVFNAFTRHYNIKHQRKGPLFLPRFHAKLITSREQFIHISRYIHLNPFSSGLIKNLNEILSYKWSSMNEYLKSQPHRLSQPQEVLAEFDGNKNRYKQFVFNNALYQKTLEMAKYLNNW